ncbi:MAG: glycosyl hydrolase [Acidobacteriaceae bacterium]|nr:glycosyl hydrolase [Acidobacteriaceae bacterium]
MRTFYLLALSTLIAAGATAPRFDSGTISGLPARNIGSAAMSGRIAAIAATGTGGQLTMFVGSASGGVWKSLDGGTTFRPIFDNNDALSIGAIAIDPTNAKTIWVGTGESWVRNSVSIGIGLYKSVDGGENWSKAGLPNSEHIAKILIDPNDGNTVYACATGQLWSDNDERGVYKTTDGGKSWRKTLAGANGSTGCGMMAMSAKEPRTLYASLWDFRRQAWTFRSGGPGSSLFKSTDGGEHWTELTTANTKGLPDKPYGRIALAVAPSKPNVVYAVIESKSGALYRSDDAGRNWTRLDASQYLIWRPFYFSNLIVDPQDPNKIFKVDGPLLLSVDGGHTFSDVANTHSDHHDVWIDPANPKVVFTGDDGGLWRSNDGGLRWAHALNLPVSQFYHVSVDNDDPYHVYGGLQDNSSWVGDSSYPGGITNSRWENMYGGDGFWMWEDPADPAYVYAEAQGGELGRINRFTHEIRSIKPYGRYGEKKLRFNWNTPVQISPNEKGTIYIGAQYVFRSRDHGQSWDRISPDLTTNNPEKQKQEESGGITVDNSAAEMHTTIYSISESPKEASLLWVGTDDGNVQLTRDAGKTWTNVAKNVSGVGDAPWVSWLEASRHDAATAYATFDRHMYGDMKPYLYRTTDYGRTWTPLTPEASGVRGYAHVIKEDTVNPQLLFLGTEFGLWISVDGGRQWAAYRGTDFPASVAVRDIVVHPRTSDLVLATHGRGIWIIDNISPLRALRLDLMTNDAQFIPPRPVVQYMETFGGWNEGDSTFRGPSRPTAASIDYYQRTRHIFGDLKIEILDSAGNLVDTVPGSKRRGLNQARWSMHLKPPKVPPAATAAFGAATGPRVLPGTYTVKMTKNDKVYTTKLDVVMDPRAPYTLEDRKAQFELSTRIAALLNRMSWAVDAVAGLRDQATARAARVNDNALKLHLTELARSADAIRTEVVATKEGGAITGEERLRELIAGLYGDVSSYEGRPTASQVERADALGRELEDVIRKIQSLAGSGVTDLNNQLQVKRLDPIRFISEEDWRKAHADELPAYRPNGGRPLY